ncbi:MAG: cysteine hydrolase [Thermotoga sp.]|nr:MAG: cysteine hydrolase [Thermotoga sp.]
MKALLLIDLQNDFVVENGALYIPGAEKVVNYACKMIDEFKDKNLPIVTTQDWHEENDLEFSRFPRHCVENTYGADLHWKIKERLENYEKWFTVKKRRFSAFFQTNFDELIERERIDSFDVCGVATNICVLFTVEELRNRDIDVTVHSAGVTTCDRLMHEFALKIMKEILGVKILEGDEG